MWEKAKVLGLRNAASKHLAVNQCHPFRCNPSSHFYEDYFLQRIPHPVPSPADKDSSKDHSAKPPRTHGTGSGARVTPATTVSLPAPDSCPTPGSCQRHNFPGAPRRVLPQLREMRAERRRPVPELSVAGDTRVAVPTPHSSQRLPQRVPPSPAPSGEQAGAQLRRVPERGTGGGALPPSPRPRRREPAGLRRRRGSWRAAFPPPRPARRRRPLTRGRTRG